MLLLQKVHQHTTWTVESQTSRRKSIRHKKDCKKLGAANKTFTAKSAEQTGSKGTTSGYVAAGQGRWKKCKAKPEDEENQEGANGVAESAY
jgi:hypothetical protein